MRMPPGFKRLRWVVLGVRGRSGRTLPKTRVEVSGIGAAPDQRSDLLLLWSFAKDREKSADYPTRKNSDRLLCSVREFLRRSGVHWASASIIRTIVSVSISGDSSLLGMQRQQSAE